MIEELTAYIYRKEGVIEIRDEKDKTIKEHIIDKRNEWFNLDYKKTHYSCNYLHPTIGVFDCYKEKGHWVTDEFIGELKVEIIENGRN